MHLKTPTIMFLLAFANVLSCIAIDIHLPFAPQMMKDLETTEEMIQFFMAVGLFLSTMTPLLWGPLSDRYGRRLLFTIASILMAIGFCGMVFLKGIEGVFVARILQSSGQGAFLTVSMAIVCDLFKGVERAKKLSILEMALPLGFMIAPLIGAEVSFVLGWRACYFMLFVAQGVFMVLINLYLPETLRIKEDVSIKSMMTSLYKVGLSRMFLPFALLSALVNACYMVFVAHGPFILIEQMGLSVRNFAFYQGALSVAYGLSLWGVRYLLNCMSRMMILRIGLFGNVIFSIVLLFAIKGIFPLNATTSFVLMLISSLASGPVITMCTSFALDQSHHSAGVKSALFEFYMGGTGAIVIALSGLSKTESIINVYFWMMGCAFIAVAFWLYIDMKIFKKSEGKPSF